MTLSNILILSMAQNNKVYNLCWHYFWGGISCFVGLVVMLDEWNLFHNWLDAYFPEEEAFQATKFFLSCPAPTQVIIKDLKSWSIIDFLCCINAVMVGDTHCSKLSFFVQKINLHFIEFEFLNPIWQKILNS